MPATGGAVLAMTHFGYLDFALVEWVTWLATRRRIRFMAKQGAFDKPVVGSAAPRDATHRGRHVRGSSRLRQGGRRAAPGRAARRVPRGGRELVVHGARAQDRRRAARRGGRGPGHPGGRLGRPATAHEAPSGGVLRAVRRARELRLRTRRSTWASDEDPHVATERLRASLQGLVDRLQREYPVDGTGAWWQPRSLGGTAPTPEEAASADAARDRARAGS